MSTQKSILVVDDDPSILKLVEFHLTKKGFRLKLVANGKAGLEELQKNDSYDLIITDALMPEMDGFDFTSSLRKDSRFQTIPILMLTQKSRRDDLKHALEVGITDFLPKPLDEALLLEKVQNLIKDAPTDVLEVAFVSKAQKAEISFRATIIRLSAKGMTLKSNLDLSRTHDFEVRSEIFQTIGITRPELKLKRCKEVTNRAGSTEYELEVSFQNLSPPDARRLNQWLEREAKRTH